ncbi:MAG: leucine-rich repeat domain-containing protein [Candidatus Poribacteria bacterium]|nr:leucine-rich repeat domain-containing protein [Candidatus Poribacteria bacterium]
MTPNEDVQGNLFIEVNAETVRDFALNLNPESVATTQPVRIDTIAPTVEITDLPTGVKGEPFDVTITFAEAVNGFTTEAIALMGPATVLLTAGTDGDAVYTARVTPNPNASGDVTLQIPAGVVEDLAENVNIASDLTAPIPIDTNALTVELKDVPDTVQLGDFSVMIVFSSDVDGFVLGDIEITGDAVVQDSTLLGTGSMYSLTVTPDENTDGDVIITVPAGVAQDATGKSNAASAPQAVAVAPSWMPDPSLRDAFRAQLNLSAGVDFTQQQVRTVTTLESEMVGISDITGVEQATTLTTLVIPGNRITDITPLRRLTRLTTLSLAGNAITNITPLAGLTGLTSLNLSGNGLTSIAALEDLTNLTTLDLSNNALTDISLLENFTELTALNLSGNRITDISPLTALTNLTTLSLNDNPIANFTPIAGLTALTTLELGGTGLRSLDAISGLTGLTVLNLRDNGLTDMTLLANLTGLTTLNLSGNTVGDLTGLTGLTGLTVLNLNDNAVIDIAPLASLTRLTTLALADNAIDTVSSLTSLTLLTSLNLTDNGITDVSPIAGLANLGTLRLMGNPILNTAPLYPLTQRVPPVDIDIEVSQYPPWDVNADGTVDAADSALVTAALGQTGDAIENPRTDVNGDGRVNNADLTLVTANLDVGVAGAPAAENLLSRLDAKTLGTLDRETLETYLHQLRLESDGSLKYRNAIAMLESLLAALRPTETRLLANYPNPFNPETWLPYALAADSSVEIFIYDARGVLVRHLELGHQPAGYYVAKSRAAYWDGRNTHGESVSSGVYFYQLRAGDVSLLRKMVILK